MTKCEERYGVDEVELLLDSCHALMNIGVDRYKRKSRGTLQDEGISRATAKNACSTMCTNSGSGWASAKSRKGEDKGTVSAEPQENVSTSWKNAFAGVLAAGDRTYRQKIAQYFYPQRQQVMNEGLGLLLAPHNHESHVRQGLVNDASMLEFIHTHSNVIAQPGFDSRFYSGINPYALGFKMMTDIKRICESPDDEDGSGFRTSPVRTGRRRSILPMRNFKDELCRPVSVAENYSEFRLFSIMDDDAESSMKVTGIHNTRATRVFGGH